MRCVNSKLSQTSHESADRKAMNHHMSTELRDNRENGLQQLHSTSDDTRLRNAHVSATAEIKVSCRRAKL